MKPEKKKNKPREMEVKKKQQLGKKGERRKAKPGGTKKNE